ncbi:MAG: hypothetical protein IJ628_03955 [Bacteroidaceae bacterium]|nr:hypothetical protein [Bacteroidaceae bacterium]
MTRRREIGMAWMALLLVAGCSQSEVVTTYQQVKQDAAETTVPAQVPQPKADDADAMPILLGSYEHEFPGADKAVTREGSASKVINNVADLASEGFGVFGYYYTGANNYEAAKGNTYPNFMYNQLVTGTETTAGSGTYNWSYSPVKYWSNETGNDGANGATTSTLGRFAFFAYAPRVAVTQADASGENEATTGKTSGIVGMTGNGKTGDPKIHYKISDLASLDEVDDLLYGTASTDITIVTVPYGDDTNIGISAGNPYKDLVKPVSTTVLNFGFRHALARFSLTVSGVFDEETMGAANKIEPESYIKIESVTLASTTMTSEGWFNLNGGTWESASTAEASFYLNASNMNPNLVYSNTVTAADIAGGVGRREEAVGTEDGEKVGDPAPGLEHTLIAGKADGSPRYFMFIPAGNVEFTVTCKYHVFTKDARMDGGWAHIVNEISNPVTLSSTAAGSTYNIHLLLGMTTVKVGNVTIHAGSGTNEERPFWIPRPK